MRDQKTNSCSYPVFPLAKLLLTELPLMLLSTGMMYCRFKQFLHHNYAKNCMASTSKASSSPLPWVLVIGDGCVMWRVRERGDQWR